MNKYTLAYDIYERHKKIASFIGKNDTVLDVGGELDHLSLFCKPKKLVVANLKTGDVIIKKDKLPFVNNSFDIITCIDVLEHIPNKNRAIFIENLLKVASGKVILSFPIGTSEHVEYERELKKNLEKKGENIDYLSEHIKFGLPTKEEILTLTKAQNKKIYFSGNLRLNKLLFKLFLFDPKIIGIRRIVYFLKKVTYFFTNELLYQFLMDKNFSEKVNRAYLIISKE